MRAWKRSLKMLLKVIPPPAKPSFVDGPILDSSLPELPEDHVALIRAYGSGRFTYERIGCVVEVFNPRDQRHAKWVPPMHTTLREFRESEGEDALPYPVYPQIPGVMICGWNDSRDHWFWYRNGSNPNKWDTVFYGDMRDAFLFKMPLVAFMQKLFFGEISRRQLSFAEPDFQPTRFRFEPDLAKSVVKDSILDAVKSAIDSLGNNVEPIQIQQYLKSHFAIAVSKPQIAIKPKVLREG